MATPPDRSALPLPHNGPVDFFEVDLLDLSTSYPPTPYSNPFHPLHCVPPQQLPHHWQVQPPQYPQPSSIPTVVPPQYPQPSSIPTHVQQFSAPSVAPPQYHQPSLAPSMQFSAPSMQSPPYQPPPPIQSHQHAPYPTPVVDAQSSPAGSEDEQNYSIHQEVAALGTNTAELM